MDETTDETEERQAAAAQQRLSRRAVMRAVGGGTAMVAAGVALSRAANAQAVTDADILNFALNLEYLEAEYYTLGTTGQGIEALGVGVSGTGALGGVTVKSSPQVPFATPAIQGLAMELAANERAHVQFLRSALGGAAVARPAIDLRDSFNAAAQAAGIGQSFDPFASETNFLLGGFLFEDVGVTAYKGAARFLENKDILEAAAGILATEGYHMGSVRTHLFNAGPAVHDLAQKISDLRDAADGPEDKDQGVVLNGMANIVPADNNAIAFSRSAGEVLRIAYLKPTGPAASGGFFPAGVNGTIRSA